MKKMTFFITVLYVFLTVSAGSAAPFVDGFEDVPFPQEMDQLENDNISFGNEEARLVEAYLTSNKTSFKKVEKFYLDTLPQLGWTFQGKNGNILSFYRDGETLDIAQEKTNPLVIRITIKSKN